MIHSLLLISSHVYLNVGWISLIVYFFIPILPDYTSMSEWIFTNDVIGVLLEKKIWNRDYYTWSKRVNDNKKSLMVLWWCTCVWIFPTRWVHDEFYPLAEHTTQWIYVSDVFSRTDSLGRRILHLKKCMLQESDLQSISMYIAMHLI